MKKQCQSFENNEFLSANFRTFGISIKTEHCIETMVEFDYYKIMHGIKF